MKSATNSGFTLVEVIIAVVIIGILATVTLAYNSSTYKKTVDAKQTAVSSSLQSDLTNASTILKLFMVENNQFPQGLDVNNCSTAPIDTRYCLKPSKGNTFTYFSSAPYQTYKLTATDINGVKYGMTNDTTPVEVVGSTKTPQN